MSEKSKKFALLIRRITPIYAVLAILIAAEVLTEQTNVFGDILAMLAGGLI